MNQKVNAIANRLSLRAPQRASLEILDRITEIASPRKDLDIQAALQAIASEYPSVTDFERDFPSLCFALATGVGKTRLMGAFISYLHLAHGLNNFFVLAPNLTIYEKLIADFTPNTPKYVFKGISEFAIDPPRVVTGDNYAQFHDDRAGMFEEYAKQIQINIFNISKIASEVRGGKAPRIKRLSEYLGESYFEYLAALPDLVLLMDESHHYRASAGLRAINELKPVLGLELTATPLVETTRGPVRFKNVIYDYPLGQAMEDKFVKDPAVVTRKNFSTAGMSPESIEEMKLQDGIRLHEGVKVELETYARETGNAIVKPFVLIIARDTTHAGELMAYIKSAEFFAGAYEHKVIQVDSSRTGAEEEAMVQKLLRVEHADEPTEIVIHVNMLKEGWDVTNLYTIIPLRAANARVLVEQSIGRGLRLPYGKRTGVEAVDRLNIVAHDKFQEIVNEANQPDSKIQLKQVFLDPADFDHKTLTVVTQSELASKLGFSVGPLTSSTRVIESSAAPIFTAPADQAVAQLVYAEIRKYESSPEGVSYVTRPEVRAKIAREVAVAYTPIQPKLDGIDETPDFEAIVARTTELVADQTIDIPRILVLPKAPIQSGFQPFTLELTSLNYQPPSEELWIQYLQSGISASYSIARTEAREKRPEDYVVSGLIDFDDIAYDENADLLYDLADQVVRHFSRSHDESDVERILRTHQREIARFVHAQMLQHFSEGEVEYEVKITKGFMPLKQCAFTAEAGNTLDYRTSPRDKSNMPRYLFVGFTRCLYPAQKFASEAERVTAVILERDAHKWFKPVKGQFQLIYPWAGEHREYQPDFVAETADTIYMLEPKAANQMTDPEVLAKRDIAVKWCRNATDQVTRHGGKPWKYLLIPHTEIAENRTLAYLGTRYKQN